MNPGLDLNLDTGSGYDILGIPLGSNAYTNTWRVRHLKLSKDPVPRVADEIRA